MICITNDYGTRCRSLGRKHVRGFAIFAHMSAPHIWKLPPSASGTEPTFRSELFLSKNELHERLMMSFYCDEDKMLLSILA